MGFNRNEPWLYLSGGNPELLDVYPELAYLRDIVYVLKAFMAPTSDALPEVPTTSLTALLLRSSSATHEEDVDRRKPSSRSTVGDTCIRRVSSPMNCAGACRRRDNETYCQDVLDALTHANFYPLPRRVG